MLVKLFFISHIIALLVNRTSLRSLFALRLTLPTYSAYYQQILHVCFLQVSSCQLMFTVEYRSIRETGLEFARVDKGDVLIDIERFPMSVVSSHF